MDLTGKQRAQLRGLANDIDTIVHIGKDGVGANLIKQADDALEARELIKITLLKNCLDDGEPLAETLAQRTRSQLVQVIGRKIVLYRPAKDVAKRKIELPR